MLVGAYTELALGRVGLRSLARGPVWVLNSGAAALDRRSPLLGELRPGSLTANLHVVANVAR
jgi:hypothetical protein